MKKLNEKFIKLQQKCNVMLSKILSEKGEDPDGGIVKWLITLGVAIGIIAAVFLFLKGFFPTFLNEIFDKVRTFFA